MPYQPLSISRIHESDEKAHLFTTYLSFLQYNAFAKCARNGISRRIAKLPADQKNFLPKSLSQFSQESKDRDDIIKDAEICNQFFLNSMLKYGRNYKYKRCCFGPLAQQWVSDDNMSKVSSVLKSITRDWSAYGLKERNMSYKPIIFAINKYLPLSLCLENTPRICIPGAGLGRLAWETWMMGYRVQGNELSLYMLLASDFILNGGLNPNKNFAICPWLMDTRNVFMGKDPANKVYIPDIDQEELIKKNKFVLTHEFSMIGGDFVFVYSDLKEYLMWDCVVCCFFLDTAPCVIEYFKVIYNMLNIHGYLIHFGPLHYHWSGVQTRPDDLDISTNHTSNLKVDRRYLDSIDICWEDVKEIVLNIGFTLIEEKLWCPAKYASNVNSFLSLDYNCIFFVARKEKL